MSGNEALDGEVLCCANLPFDIFISSILKYTLHCAHLSKVYTFHSQKDLTKWDLKVRNQYGNLRVTLFLAPYA